MKEADKMKQLLNEILDTYKDEMIENLQKIISIKSISGQPEGDAPFGKKVQEALDFSLDLGKKKGFNIVNYQNYAAEMTFGKQKESIGVMCHLDVVPEGKGWTFPPYEGKIHNGKIYGRGAVDDKGCFIAAFYACLALKESGLPLSKAAKHIIGTSEENGDFPCIQYYLEHAEIPECGIVPDSWFPIAFAEKGILSYYFRKQIEKENCGNVDLKLVKLNGGEAFNVVAPFAEAVFEISQSGKQLLEERVKSFVEDRRAEITFEGNLATVLVKGKSAHASTPEIGVNAISVLLQILNPIEFAPIDLCKTLKILCQQVGNDYDGTGLNIKSEDLSGPLTNNVGMLELNENELVLKMNIRAPISFDLDKLEQQLKIEAIRSGVRYEKSFSSKHFYIDKEEPLVRKLLSVYQEMTGDTESKPKTHGGGSYARILKNFVPFGPSFQGEELVFHKQDEHISCDRLLLLSKIYAQALYELAK